MFFQKNASSQNRFVDGASSVLGTLFLLAGMPAFAGTSELDAEDETDRDDRPVIESEITVSSSIPELAFAFELTGDEIESAGNEDLAEFLRGIAGLSAVRRGPLNLEPAIRGLQEEEVGMFVDGTRTFAAGPARMDSNISHISPHAVQNIQVVKGPYALTWGSGTLSALRIETFRPEFQSETFGGTLHLGYGENAESADAFGNVWGSNEKWRWTLNVGHRTGEDYEAGDGSLVPADYESTEGRWLVGYQPADDLRIEYSGGYQEQSDIDYPGRLLDATYFYARSNALDLTWNGSGKVSEIYAQLFSNRKDHRMNNDGKPTAQPNPNRIPPFALRVDLPTESNTWGGRFRVGVEGDQFDANFGLDYYKVEQTAVREIFRRENDVRLFRDIVWPDAEIEDLGGYAQMIYRAGKAQVGATVRVDDVDAASGELSEFFRANTTGDPDQSETNVSAAISALFEVDPHWTLSAGVGRAVRSATVLERYSDRFPSTKFQLAAEFMGNPELDPEESLEWNLGARARYGDFTFEVDLFYRTIDDYITVAPDPDLPKRLPLSPPVVYRYINGDEATFYGGELLLYQKVSRHFSWRGALAYVRADDELFDEPVLGIAPLNGEVGIRYHGAGQRLWIDLAAHFADRQDRVATSRFEQETPGYTTYDLLTQYSVTESWSVRAGVENLTDRAYAHHLNSPNPFSGQRIPEIGRNVHIGLDFRF